MTSKVIGNSDVVVVVSSCNEVGVASERKADELNGQGDMPTFHDCTC